MCDASLPLRNNSPGELSYACPICGYELIGLNQQRCSECGVLVSREDAVVAWMQSLGVSFAPQFLGKGLSSFKLLPHKRSDRLYWTPPEVFAASVALVVGIAALATIPFAAIHWLYLVLIGIGFVYYALGYFLSAPVLSYHVGEEVWCRHTAIPGSRGSNPVPLEKSYVFLHTSRQVGFTGNGFACTFVVGDHSLVVCASDRAEDIRAYLDRLPDEIVQRSVSSIPQFETLAWSEGSPPDQ